MINYFSIEPNRIKSLEDYLCGIESSFKRQSISTMFQVATSVFIPINTAYGTNFDQPIIRISNNPMPDAQGMEGMIEISEGLINHCLLARFGDFNEIMGQDAPMLELNPGIVAQGCLTWVMAHEYFHIVRRHNEVLQKHGNDHESLHAIERDADLCAVAELFRMNQWYFGKMMTTSQIRRLTLYLIFWAIRTFPQPSDQSTHLSSAIRLWHIVVKLSIITEFDNSNQIPDIDCKLPETHENAKKLTECLVKCEISFAEIYKEEGYESLIPKLMDIIENGTGDHAVIRWDRIRKDASKISNTTA